MSTFETVASMIAKQLRVDVKDITEEKRLVQDLKENPRSYENLHNTARWLQDNECKTVVTEFWLGNAIAEYSNGEIEVFVINDFDYPSIYEYLQEKDHNYVPLNKDTYVVIPEKYKSKIDLSYYDKNATLAKDYYELLIYRIN